MRHEIERYDAMVGGPLFAGLFGRSGLFNVGLWSPEIATPAAAAARLAHEMVSRLPGSARTVLEIAAGSGGTAAEAARSRPATSWFAADLSLRRLVAARALAPAARLLCCDASALPVAPESVDAVLAIEAAFHFPSRERFLAAAREALRPGGSLLLTDLVVADGAALGDWMFPSANHLRSRTDYLALLERCGFAAIALEDWTERSWMPFLRFLEGRDRQLVAAGELAEDAAAAAAAERARRADPGAGFVGYFAVSARRPD